MTTDKTVMISILTQTTTMRIIYGNGNSKLECFPESRRWNYENDMHLYTLYIPGHDNFLLGTFFNGHCNLFDSAVHDTIK